MYIQRDDNAKLDYHVVGIDPFHDSPQEFRALYVITKQWGSEKGVPVWHPATIGIMSIELLPEQIGQWQQGLDVAMKEAIRLDCDYPPGRAVPA